MSEWIDCWNCGGECVTDHDCGEDTCCCLHPELNVICNVCAGGGGWEADECLEEHDVEDAGVMIECL